MGGRMMSTKLSLWDLGYIAGQTEEKIKSEKLAKALRDMINYHEELNESPSPIFIDTAKQTLEEWEEGK
jgi:hypothetical protein